MVAQNMLRTHEDFRRKKNKCLQQIEMPDLLHMCAPHSELPSNIRTMGLAVLGGQLFFNYWSICGNNISTYNMNKKSAITTPLLLTQYSNPVITGNSSLGPLSRTFFIQLCSVDYLSPVKMSGRSMGRTTISLTVFFWNSFGTTIKYYYQFKV